MKKILYGFLALIAVFLLALYITFFSPLGNKMLAFIAEDKLRASTGLDINISRFELGFSSLDLLVKIANIAEARVHGNLKLFALAFDLDYLVSLDKNYIQSMSLNPKDEFTLAGKIWGKASDFELSGKGYFLGSNLNLDARVFDYSPLELKLLAKGIRLEELLDILAKPRYFSGLLDINADIKAKDLIPNGNALINLAINSINYKLIEQDFKLILPKGSELSSEILATIQGNDIFAQSKTYNSYASLTNTKAYYELTNKTLKSDFKLLIPELSKLESLMGMKIQADMLLDGNISTLGTNLDEVNTKLVANKILALDLPSTNAVLIAKAKSENDLINFTALLDSTLLQITDFQGFYRLVNDELSFKTRANISDLAKFEKLAGTNMQGSVDLSTFAHLIGTELKALKTDIDIAGGKIEANSNGKTLDIFINKLDLAKALVLVAQPAYINGLLSAKAHLNSLDLNKLSGSYEAKSNGTFGAKVLSAMLDKNFPENTSFDLDLKGNIKDSIANFKLIFNSDLANLENFEGFFDINKMLFNSSFKLNAYDFSKLSFLADRKLSGKAILNANVSFDKSMNVNITSEDIFSGKLNAVLKADDFKANLSGVDMSALMRGLDLPDLYEAKANADFTYNLASSLGDINVNLSGGKLKKTELSNALSLLIGKDITNDVFHTARANFKLLKDISELNLNLQANRSQITIDKGIIDSNSNLNMPFKARIDRAEFLGSIVGTSENMRLKLDPQSILQSIDKILGKKEQEAQGGKEDIKQELDKQIDKGLNKLFQKIF